MNNKEKNDLFYLCCLIEYISRKTKNLPADIVKLIGLDKLNHLYKAAEVNHCLSFEQVSDEIIDDCSIMNGCFDIVANCKSILPKTTAIGKLYQRLIIDVMKNNDVIDTLISVYTSFISNDIVDYNTALYYSGRSFLKACYEEQKILM